ncbi:MAG TPA: hypothetical protein VMN82_05635 [Thermoanaerobaculia bacterium]|nr:hypothetical protein [Thermoanaerobaculia bacterium]
MDDIETPIPALPRRRPLLWNGGRVEGLFEGIERRFTEMGTLKTVLVVAGGTLVLDHLIAPKGMSLLSKTWEKVSGKEPHHALPPIPPPIPAAPPPLPPPAPKVGSYYFPFHPELFEGSGEHAAGDFTGANLQAGWNRGMDPYGPWAVADPMGQYAHAAQRRRTGHMGHYDWEE